MACRVKVIWNPYALSPLITSFELKDGLAPGQYLSSFREVTQQAPDSCQSCLTQAPKTNPNLDMHLVAQSVSRKFTHLHVYSLSGTWDTAKRCRTVCKIWPPLPCTPLTLPQTLWSSCILCPDFLPSRISFPLLEGSHCPFLLNNALYP